MKTLKRFSVLILCLFMLMPLVIQTANAATPVSSNIMESNTNLTSSNNPPSGSSVCVYEDMLKVSIYLGTSDNETDFPKNSEGKVDPTKANINKMVKFGESIFISPDGYLWHFGTPKANVTTDKFDAIKSNLQGSNPVPSYSYSITKNTIEISGSYPTWYNGNLTTTSVKAYFENDPEHTLGIIRKIAMRYGSGSTVQDKINSLLDKANAEMPFSFSGVDKITYKHINPQSSNNDFIVPIAVIVEPVVFFYEAPKDSISNPNSFGKTYAMTPTDMALTATSSTVHTNYLLYEPRYKIWYCNGCGRSGVTSDIIDYRKCWRSSTKATEYFKSCEYFGIEISDKEREEVIAYYNCPDTDGSHLTWGYKGKSGRYWYTWCVEPIARDSAKFMRPDKDWFNGFVATTSDSSFKPYSIQNVVRYGGYSVFFVSGKTTPEKPVMEVRVIDTNMNPIVGVANEAGMTPKQDTVKMDENLAELLKSATDEFKQKLQQWVQTAKNTIHNLDFKGVQKQDPYIVSTDDFIPVVFDDIKLGQIEINNKTSELVNGMLGHADVIKHTPNDPETVYLYTDEMLNLYQQIEQGLQNGTDVSGLTSQYVSIAGQLESEYQNYMSQEDAEEDPTEIDTSIGTIHIRESIDDPMVQIGWADTFILLGENPAITDPHNPDVILDVENPPKVNIVIPVVATPKLTPNKTTVTITPGDIKEDELTKGLYYDFYRNGKVTETIPKTTCKGYKWETHYRRYTYTYNCDKEDCTSCPHTGVGWEPYDAIVDCGHSATLENKKSFKIETAHITTDCYWHIKMLDTDPAKQVHPLSVLRTKSGLTNDGVNFVFNITSNYDAPETEIQDVYKRITWFRYVGHRSAEKDGKEIVQLAAYMNETDYNDNFIKWIDPYFKPYFGSEYPSAYRNQTGFFGQNDYSVKTELKTPTIGISGTLTACGTELKTAKFSKILYGVINHPDGGAFITNSDVIVEPTYEGTNKANTKIGFKTVYTGYAVGKPEAYSPPTECSYHIRIPSRTYVFNPAFKINYYKDNQNASKDQVWILAKGDRTFNGTDYFKVELTTPSISVTSQWSRDLEDENSPTAKSGSTIRANSNGSVVTIYAWYNVLDPDFVGKPGSAEHTAAQKLVDEIAKEYDTAAQNIINKYLSKENGFASFYTNMYQAAIDNTVHKPTSDPFNNNLTEKTQFKYDGYQVVALKPTTKAYYVDANDTQDYEPKSRSISLNGETVSLSGKWTDDKDPNGVVDSDKRLKELILEKKGYNKKWYNEDYEGIIVVYKVWRIEFNQLSIKYAQIHPEHSDNLTERNARAEQLKFAFQDAVLINAGKYGIGTEFRIPSVTLNGNTVPEGALVTKPYLYDIRGSIYDIK